MVAPLKQETAADAREAAPELPRVDWKKSPSLRKLYFYAVILCVASATTGSYLAHATPTMPYLTDSLITYRLRWLYVQRNAVLACMAENDG